MKNKEFIIMISGSLMLLGFVIYMLIYSFNMNKTGLIREDIKNDSIIMKENRELKISNSNLQFNIMNLEKKLNTHENKIKKLENRKPIIRKDTVILIY